MYVCICNAVTDKQIRKAAAAGASSVWDLQEQLGLAAGCGSCIEAASEILSESGTRSKSTGPILYQPSVATI